MRIAGLIEAIVGVQTQLLDPNELCRFGLLYTIETSEIALGAG